MYVAVKGGERAIENAHRLLAHERRGDRDVPELSLAQISEQLSLGVDLVMTEGSLYDRELACAAHVERDRAALVVCNDGRGRLLRSSVAFAARLLAGDHSRAA